MTRRTLAAGIALLVSSCTEGTTPTPTISAVTFDRHAATLWAGDVLSTSVSVTRTDGMVVANPKVAYVSSNSVVASVDNRGRIYTHVAGEATISAAIGSIRDTLHVSVLWPPVTQVTFRDDSLVMFIGDTAKTWLWVLDRHGNYATHATVIYSSSASNVATIDDSTALPCRVATCNFEPRVVALGEGRATITVTAQGFSDSLPVIVARR